MSVVLGRKVNKLIEMCRSSEYTHRVCAEHDEHILVKGVKSFEPAWGEHTTSLIDSIQHVSPEGSIIQIASGEPLKELHKLLRPKTFNDTLTVAGLLTETVEAVKNYGSGEPDYVYMFLAGKLYDTALNVCNEAKLLLKNMVNVLKTNPERETVEELEEQLKVVKQEHKIILDINTKMVTDLQNNSFVLQDNWEYHTIMLPCSIVEALQGKNFTDFDGLITLRMNNIGMQTRMLQKSEPLRHKITTLFRGYKNLEELTEPEIEINMETNNNIIVPNVETHSWVETPAVVADLIDMHIKTTRLDMLKKSSETMMLLMRASSNITKMDEKLHY